MPKQTKKPKQLWLFDDEPVQVNKNSKPTNSLQIRKKGNKPISLAQKRFNGLVKKIDKVKKDIELAKSNALVFGNFYSQYIAPVEKEIGNAYYKFAAVLDEYAQRYPKVSKKHQEMFYGLIDVVIDYANSHIEPDEEQKKLFEKYNDVSYDESVNEQIDEMYEDLRNFVKYSTGVDMGEMDFDINDTESAMNFAQNFAEKLEAQQKENEARKKNQKKTKREIEQEQTLLLETEMKNKSIRSIYISLAKVLHPDTESDENTAKEKSELMKKVTHAYKANDLTTLLRLELEWINRTNERLDELSEEKLKLYNDALQAQFDELSDELHFITLRPDYEKFSGWLLKTEVYGIKQLNNELKNMNDDLKNVQKDTLYLSETKRLKKEWTNFLEKNNVYDDDDDFDFDLDDDILDKLMRKIINNS